VELVKAALAEPRHVVRLWHPAAEGELLDLGNGINAEIQVGDPAYQLTSGEIVAL
jgi:hypothetical protein